MIARLLPATDEEIRAASLQFVRKLSGFNTPSKANQLAFDAAIAEVFQAGHRLLHALENTENTGSNDPLGEYGDRSNDPLEQGRLLQGGLAGFAAGSPAG